MKTFHEWLAEREQTQCEGLWLNDKNAVIGLSKMNPLPRFSGEQELEAKAEIVAVRRAGIQAVEACSTGQTATLQTGTACEDRDAESTDVDSSSIN